MRRPLRAWSGNGDAPKQLGVLLLSAGLVLAIGWMVHLSPAQAALQSFYVPVSNTAPATSTAVLFTFKPGVTVPPGSKVFLSFDPAFTLPVSPAPTDAQFTLDGVTQSLGATQTTSTNAYGRSGAFLVFTVASGTTIQSASSVRMTVGRDGGVITPGAPGDYGVSARVVSPSGSQLNVNSSYIVIRQQVMLSASASSTSPSYVIRWATPELRVGPTETNDDAVFYLTVRNASNTSQVLYTSPALATTSNDGTYFVTTTLTGVSSGVYDVGIKTQQHLTKLIYSVPLSANTTTVLNFTNTTNTAVKGPQRLASGDISGAGTSPATLGDDVVNSVDLSALVNKLDADDPSGNGERANLNEDPVVNSVDLSMLIAHLDQEGDR